MHEMERDTRFELAPPAWKAGMLTINTNPANCRSLLRRKAAERK